MIIGDKHKIAIEIKSIRGRFIKARIWIEDRYFGSINDESMIGPLSNVLEDLLLYQNYIEVVDDIELDKLNLFNQTINSESIEADRTLFSFPESFDHFLIRVYKTGNKLLFLWRLVDKTSHLYSGLEQDIIYSGNVDIMEFINVYEEFVNDIEVD